MASALERLQAPQQASRCWTCLDDLVGTDGTDYFRHFFNLRLTSFQEIQADFRNPAEVPT